MEANNSKLYSNYEVIIYDLNGLNEADLQQAFSDFKVLERRILDNPRGPRAFITFASPDEQQRALKSKIVVKGRRLLLKKVIITNQKKEDAKIERIRKTVDINTEKYLDFCTIGYSNDQVIDLSQKELHFKFVITNKTILPKQIKYIGFPSTKRSFFECKVKSRVKLPRVLRGNDKLELDLCFTHQLEEPSPCFTALIIQTDRARYPYEFIFNVTSLHDLQAIAKTGEYKELEDLVMPSTIIAAPPIEKASRSHIHTPVETLYTVRLPPYDIPENIKETVMKTDTYPDFFPWRNKERWIERLHQLLWFEEVELEKRSHRFDLRSVTIAKVSRDEILPDKKRQLDAQLTYSEISVPGLAENRPSVLYNDYVFAWSAGSTNCAYEGRVVRVKEKSILVVFQQDFHDNYDPSTLFNVRFRFDRLHMRTWHRALDTIDVDILWPSKQSIPHEPVNHYTQDKLQWHDDQIRKNPEQAQAIVNMLNKTNGSAPYLLFGPFGTGKTKCLIEYARQLVALDPNCRILICAHSNSGTNKICLELMKTMSTTELFRLFSFNANPNRLGEILQYTIRDEARGVFLPPPMEQLRSFKIILSTGDNAALLHGIGVGSNHFTHILVDEAAEFSEPGIAVPLCLASKATTVVLAGDSKQTSPRIFSRIAKHHGLDKSLMERLSNDNIYRIDDGEANPSVCTHLVRNYRSHPYIIQFLSQQFYQNRLICETDPNEYRALEQWDKKGTTKTFPFLFYALDNSKEDREADSPAYFNSDEASTITRLIANLRSSIKRSGEYLRQQDICVVSASRKQTEKILELMKLHKLGKVEVGTTEALQGREFKAIFISTVRSNADLLDFDRQHNIGFIADDKRFNTAISRAIALVVVVGNSRLLARERMWNNFIRYCDQNNSYINLMNGALGGIKLIEEMEAKKQQEELEAKKKEHEEKVRKHLAAKKLAKSAGDGALTPQGTTTLSQSDGVVDQPFKSKVTLPPRPDPIHQSAASDSNHVAAPVLSLSDNHVPANPVLSNSTGNLIPSYTVVTNYSTPNGVQQYHSPYNGWFAPQQQSLGPNYQQTIPWTQQNHGQLHAPGTQLLQSNHLHPQQPHFGQLQLHHPLQQSAPQSIQGAQLTVQANVQQLPQNAQTNGYDDSSWTSVDKAKSMILSQHMGKTLIEAFKDKGLKGYPPFTVEKHATTDAFIITFYAIKLNCQCMTRDQFVIFEFSTVPNDFFLVNTGNMIPFETTTNSGQNGSDVVSRIRLNVPDGFKLQISTQFDRIVVYLFPVVLIGRLETQILDLASKKH